MMDNIREKYKTGNKGELTHVRNKKGNYKNKGKWQVNIMTFITQLT